MVREPRALLAEMGLRARRRDVEVEVHDSSSEVRYMVLPERPAGTDDLSEEELAALVTRDAMVGVATVAAAGMTRRSQLLDVDGPAAPPRRNGELVFAEPWESRAFGMAFALHERGAFTWEEFRQALIAADRGAGRAAATSGRYYRCWLEALEGLAVDRALVDAGEVAERADALAARPAGHDHGGHGHDHDHDHDHEH